METNSVEAALGAGSGNVFVLANPDIDGGFRF